MFRKPSFRLVPPAGHPIALGDVARALIRSFKQGEGELSDMVRSYIGMPYCFLASSGTAALYLILKTRADVMNRREVVIPAYCCPSLVAAAVRAGLKVRLCDIRKDSFDFDLGQLDTVVNEKTLCVLAVHLFGLPVDMEQIGTMASENGAAVVEDSAQAFGVEIDGLKLGTRGDVGFYSFGRGKPLSMLGGGAIVTRLEAIGEQIGHSVEKLHRNPSLTWIDSFMKVGLYSVFVHPHLYWIANSLPLLELGKTKYVGDFGVYPMCRYHVSLGETLLGLNRMLNERRMEISQLLIERLRSLPDDCSFSIPHVNVPFPYLRLPVIFSSPHARERVLRDLVRNGIGATRMYAAALPRIQDVFPHLCDVVEYPNAEYVASRLLTLPVNPFVNRDDMERVAEMFAKVLGDAKRV